VVSSSHNFLFLCLSHFRLEVCVHVFPVVVFRDGNPLADSSVLIRTLHAAVVRLHY
jgi:hypothetical protein